MVRTQFVFTIDFGRDSIGPYIARVKKVETGRNRNRPNTARFASNVLYTEASLMRLDVTAAAYEHIYIYTTPDRKTIGAHQVLRLLPVKNV